MTDDIRDATRDDLPRILAITNEAIANTTALWTLTPTALAARAEWYEERRRLGFPVLVASIGGEVLGFASFGSFRPWEAYERTVEHSLYIDAAARGRGLGSALLAALVRRAEAGGMHAMVGGIEAGNAASLRLHARLGFREAGRLREVGRKFGRWLDLVFMELLLGGGR